MKQILSILLLCAMYVSSRSQIQTSTWADPTNQYSASSFGLCLGCSLTGLSNIADQDMNNSATLSVPVGAIISTTFRAKLPHLAPGNSYAGFLVATTSLLGALPIVTLSTYKNGVHQETITGGGSLLTVASSTAGFVCGQSNATKPYDEVGITFTTVLAGLGMVANVYYAYSGVANCPTLSTVLPVGFSSADLKTPQGVPAIHWTVETGNASWYSIERSTDAKHFTETGRVNAAASIDDHLFSYTDYNAPDSMSWYRIGAHNADGNVGYSSVMTFTPAAAAENGMRIFPNPIDNHFTVRVPGFSGNGVLEIYSLQGQLVEKQISNNAGSTGSLPVTLSHPLNPGIYILQLTDVASNYKWRSKLVSH